MHDEGDHDGGDEYEYFETEEETELARKAYARRVLRDGEKDPWNDSPEYVPGGDHVPESQPVHRPEDDAPEPPEPVKGEKKEYEL